MPLLATAHTHIPPTPTPDGTTVLISPLRLLQWHAAWHASPLHTLSCTNLLSLISQQDLSAKPGPGSCRSGAVVHLVAANNSKVPVTLQLSQHDDGDHIQHVIRVSEISLHVPGVTECG